jgi:hypothetical protein
MTDQPDIPVGVLGIGLMESAMVHRLLEEGVPAIAWDRNPAHAEPLAERGAEIAATASDVVEARPRAVITMLPTAEVVLSVVEPLLDPPGRRAPRRHRRTRRRTPARRAHATKLPGAGCSQRHVRVVLEGA